MARQNQETITTFGEVLHSSNISYSQNRSSSNDSAGYTFKASSDTEKIIMKRIAEGATRIFLACGKDYFL